jgi:beta-N-acetylhexosaminidase
MSSQLAASCLLPGFDGLDPPDDLLRWVERGLLGVVLFGRNVRDREQLRRLTTRLYDEQPALVVATDEEGGDVTRLEAATGSSYPSPLALGAVDDVELTRSVAAALGSELADVGVNLDLAPVADVNTNPSNPVIGVRSFGAEPQLVARHVAAFVDGIQGAGVGACAKHFPGHGDTSADSHVELPVTRGVLEDHLEPFRAAIAAGVRAIMTAHIVVPELGSEPATINPAAIRLLREELGFDGVIVTDAIEMRGVAALAGPEEAAVRALEAGVDAVCLGHDLPLEPVHAAIVEALASGRLSADARGAASIRLSRLATGIPRSNGVPRSAIGAEAAKRALRVEGDARIGSSPLVVELVATPNIAAGPRARWLAELVRQRWPEAEVARVGPDERPPEAAGRPLVVVLQDAARHAWQQEIASSRDAVVVETGLPAWRPERAAGFVVTHGAGRASLEAALDLLAGRDVAAQSDPASHS